MSTTQTDDYARIERVIRHLDGSFRNQPDLASLAGLAGLSPWHFQRMFRRWAGISPKRFVQFLTADHARRLLARSVPVLDAAFEAGLSGPSRLHDLMVATDALTPGDVRRGGQGLVLRYGLHDSPFGPCGLALTGRGVCFLGFGPSGQGSDGWLAERLGARWPQAELIADGELARDVVGRIFGPGTGGNGLRLHLRGTNFQIKVWEALLRVPPGAVISYRDLACRIGSPRAVRATASAVARNPVAFLIPCHRVIRKSRPFHDYAWGAERKKAMLFREQARPERQCADPFMGEAATRNACGPRELP